MSDSKWGQQRTAQEYEAYYETKYRRADSLEKKLLTQLFAQFPGSRSALEVGCGTGHFTRWIESALGLECVGVDTSKAMLKEAKKRWSQGDLLQGEGTRLPLTDKSVDIVVFVTSLEFIPDASGALKEAARVAKQGIALGLMNKDSPSTLRKGLQAATRKSSFYRQAKFYSISDIKKMLEKALPEEFKIEFWNTTVFPKAFGSWESSLFPFGAFLGVAIKLEVN